MPTAPAILGRLLAASDSHLTPDADLLARFTSLRDQDAFAELARRHGRMVRSAARRVVRDPHLADDVTQAVFLVLARKAGRLSRPDRLAGWLFGVTRRIARKAARQHSQHAERTRPLTDRADARERSPEWDDRFAILDEELARLPEGERAALVLCYLEGLTQDEAARACGWSVRTLRRRLAAGRDRLRGRLERRGVELGAVLMALAMGPTTEAFPGAAAPLAPLTSATGRVANLARAELRPWWLVTSGWAVGVVALAGVAMGLGAQQRPETAPAPHAPQVAKSDSNLPAGAVLRLGSDALRHPNNITHLRFSDDGNELISYGHGKLRRWDIKTGAAIRPANPPHDIATADRANLLSLDCTRLIAPYWEHAHEPYWISIRDYDLATGRHTELFTIPQRTGPDGKPNFIGYDRFARSPDGALLVEGHRHEAYVWDLGTKKVRHHLRLPGEGNFHFLFTPDSKHLVTAGGDARMVVFWDVATGKQTRILDPGEGWGFVSGLALSADGRWMASTDNMGIQGKTGSRMAIWDLTADARPREVAITDGFGFSLAFGPGALYVISTPIGGSVVITRWDPATGKQLARWPVGNKNLPTPPTAAVSPDGTILAVGDYLGVIHLFDTQTGGEVVRPSSHTAAVKSVTFDSRGGEIRTVGSDGSVMTWDAKTGREKARRDLPVPLAPPGRVITSVASPDGRWALTFEPHERGQEPPWHANLWDVSTGEAKYGWSVGGWGQGLIPLPGGKLLAAYMQTIKGDKLQAWDTTTGESLPEIDRVFPGYRTHYVAFPDGKTFLTCSEEQAIAFDLTTGREAFSWNLVDRRIIDWKIPKEKELIRPSLVRAVAVSPDGKMLALAIGRELFVDGSSQMSSLALVEATTGKLIRRVWKPTSTEWLTFSPDGRWLAGSQCVWDVATLKEARRFPAIPQVMSAGFSPDSRHIATGHANGTAVVWPVGKE